MFRCCINPVRSRTIPFYTSQCVKTEQKYIFLIIALLTFNSNDYRSDNIIFVSVLNISLWLFCSANYIVISYSSSNYIVTA